MPIRIDQLDMLDKLKLDDRRMKFICTFYDHSIGLAPPDDWVKNILNDARAWKQILQTQKLLSMYNFLTTWVLLKQSGTHEVKATLSDGDD